MDRPRRPPDPNTAEVSPFDRVRARGLIAQTIVIGFAAVALISTVLPGGQSASNAGLFGLMVYAGVVVLLLVRGYIAGVNWGLLFGSAPKVAWAPLLAVVVPLALISVGAAYIVFTPLSYVNPELVERILKGSEIYEPKTLSEFAATFAVLVIAAPVTEELFVRGFLLHRWARRWGTSTAVVATSMFFAIGHSEWVGHFLTGAVLSLLYLRSRSLWLPIIAHSLNNMLAALPIGWALYTHDKTDSSMTLAELRDSLGLAVVAFVAGVVLLLMYKDLYWPKGMITELLSGPTPYEAPADEVASTSVS